MFKCFFTWLTGYIKIKIQGDNRERLVNIFSANNIHLWNVEKKDNYITACMSYKNFRLSKEYMKKTGADVYLVEKNGLPYFVRQYKKRYGFVIGFILFFVMIYIFTMFIWDINVKGEDQYTNQQIVKEIRDNYVSFLTPRSEINCDELEKELRAEYEKIAWISCDIKGTSLNINIMETVDKSQVKKSSEPCNIVAIKDGILTDVVVRSGKATREKGDEVKKGDILISGTVNIYNDYDELLETNYVASDGDVYAIVEYNYIDDFNLYSYEKEYTGNKKKRYGIFLGEKYIPVGFRINYELYDQVVTEHRMCLGSSVYLPIYFNTITVREYESIPRMYTKEEAREKAEKRLGYYIDNLQKKGVKILENNVKIDVDEDKCHCSGTIITRELIGVPQTMTTINQGEEQ